jgi:hypothetical protein
MGPQVSRPQAPKGAGPMLCGSKRVAARPSKRVVRQPTELDRAKPAHQCT